MKKIKGWRRKFFKTKEKAITLVALVVTAIV